MRRPSETPATGERVECTEDATSSDEIRLILKGIDIDTTGDNAPGVYGRHVGSGNVEFGAQDAYITKTGARPQRAGGPTLHAGPHAVRMASAPVRFILALLKESSTTKTRLNAYWDRSTRPCSTMPTGRPPPP